MISPVRMLGLCGLVSSVLSAAGGLANVPVLIGVAGMVMLAGNVYALVRA